ncbi:P-type conjugative transfer protein TrbL [Bradyrhizobium sp.]|uniref:P-type conjugative transfer protein TrbL n=1 Tax=Bradyrhizobium sp. TaxID=376 RepID=UPI001EC3458A|nr:P-type conjugative transfer protein TrbL [Bradyrhizobium sp.]MBV8920955.1 P-type conjugative transfer protein TrbL [Bradyrhizobium sp.]MBV9980668.1 P-type conjugative transfer protein TrbL [Bradyrhizobium sp.]
MGGTGIIDQFLETFTRYIDNGFGLLGGEVGYLATTLAAIDITLAGLFWSWGADEDILARLVKKTLFVGLFAFLIGNWNSLARIVFKSFAGLGLKASGTGLSTVDFLRPGKIAQVGLDAGRPILDSISGLMGYVSFFENFVQIAVLLFAWVVVLLAFFILAIQLFITLIEFKLTTLAGFVLIPFGLFGKTAFAAERVLGNVISSGIKVLVLAVIVGIGSTLFAQFTAGFGGNQPTIDNAMALVLGALSLLGLGIFGPGIANGIVSGGPQLGAGAAVGTGLAAGGAIVAGAGLAAGAAGLAGSAIAGGARAATAVASGAASAYRAGGLRGVAETGGSAIISPLRRMAAGTSNSQAADAPPPWARRMKRAQTVNQGVSAAIHAVRSGDSAGGGASVDLSEGGQ